MRERMKVLRKKLGLTQQQFADQLGIKRNTVANYESGRNDPMEAVISLICKTFDVNEAWIRDGVGNMFRKQDEEIELMTLAEQLNISNDFRARLVRAILKLSNDQLFVLEDFCRELVAVPPEIHNVRPKAPSPLNDEEMTIEEKVNAYRIALETEAHRGKGAKSEAC